MRRALGKLWFPAAIVLLYTYNFPYFAGINSANELPRIYLAMAMVDRGAFNIDPELARLGDTPDTSTFKGKRYSNKAPGMSLLAAPAYAVLKWVSSPQPPALRTSFFWLRLVGSTLPSLAFLLLLWRFLGALTLVMGAGRKSHGPLPPGGVNPPGPPELGVRRLLLAAYALGTMAFTYGTLLIAHQLSSLLCATAFILLFSYARTIGGGGRWTPLWAGLAAASGVLVDYQVAFIGPPLAGYALWAARRRGASLRGAALFCAGCIPPFAALLFYQWVCFDSPLRTGYHHLTNPVFSAWHAQGFLGLAKFHWAALVERHFSADDGLFYYSPFLLLALPGLVLMLLRRELRAEALLCGGLILFFVYFASSLAFASGWDVGPRYVTCALPYYLPPIAVLASLTARKDRWYTQIPVLGLVAVSIAIYVTIMAVFPHYPDNFSNPWFDVTLRFGRAGYVAYNLGWLLGLRGLPSALPYLAIAAALLVALLGAGGGLRRWQRGAVVAGALALAFSLLVLYYSGLSRRTQPVPVGFLPWMERIWEPRHRGMNLQRLMPAGDPRTGGLATRK